MHQESLTKLKALAESKSPTITEMPISKSISYKIRYSVIKIINIKDTPVKLCEELTDCVENVDDPIIRVILT